MKTVNQVIDQSVAFWASYPIGIEWRGVRVTLASNKCRWKTIPAARLALISHVETCGLMFDIKRAMLAPEPVSYHKDEVKAFVDQQINDGEIKFFVDKPTNLC